MRRLVLAFLLLAAGAGAQDYPAVLPDQPLRFPADHGAHPAFRIEWWYVTGWLKTEDQRDLGFQVTFFRTRPAADQDNPSRFSPRQILFAHAALSDPAKASLSHDQRIARQGFGLAGAALGNTDITLDDWSFQRGHDGIFTGKITAEDFALDLTMTPTQPVLPQGENGFSRKGPLPSEASYYFSLPHLAVGGEVTQQGKRHQVTGEAWLDREWSSAMLDPAAIGWDWLGVNLTDGGALMVFQMRGDDGRPIWAGGSWRDKAGAVTKLAPQDVTFETTRSWHSPRTGADYPVQRRVTVRLKDGTKTFTVTPLFDDQELDSRMGGGPVYWEGAVKIEGDASGRGYLELTGYLDRLTL